MSKVVHITDNHRYTDIVNCVNESLTQEDKEVILDDLSEIADTAIEAMSFDDNPNLLVFPQILGEYGDDIGKGTILSLNGDQISTGNIMGFVGINDTQVDIKSRFSKNDPNDYFLHYMLQRVFSINLFDIKHDTADRRIFDFLLYLFPHFLKKALAQGLFKKYRKFEHNDANVRGPIDINRHIRQNIPFRGTIAYTTREHSYDNELTQLISHTIEFIKTKPLGSNVLTSDVETRECVKQITFATTSYSQRERQKVINKNLRPVRHPYFSEYTALQKICLQILRHESLKYGQEKDKIYGILFDGAWLWEEYLFTILGPLGFKHPHNKSNEGGIRMFQNHSDDEAISINSRRLYPDFYKDDFILDAKYKHLSKGVSREDLYQVVTYMYCKTAKNGGYVYPNNTAREQGITKYVLEGYGGVMHLIPFYVPQANKDSLPFKEFKEFCEDINQSETSLSESINPKGV